MCGSLLGVCILVMVVFVVHCIVERWWRKRCPMRLGNNGIAGLRRRLFEAPLYMLQAFQLLETVYNDKNDLLLSSSIISRSPFRANDSTGPCVLQFLDPHDLKASTAVNINPTSPQILPDLQRCDLLCENSLITLALSYCRHHGVQSIWM